MLSYAIACRRCCLRAAAVIVAIAMPRHDAERYLRLRFDCRYH